MRTLAYVFTLVALLLVQTTLSNILWIFGVKPDLPLVFALCMAMVKGEKAGALTGFLNGFLEDILFGRFLGLNTLIKSVTAYIVGYGSRNIYKGPVIITMALTFIGSFIFNFLFMVFAFLTREAAQSWYSFFSIVIPSALLNMVISPLIYHGVFKMERFFDFYFDIKY